MKVSDVDNNYLANFLRIDEPSSDDLDELTNIITNVVDYIVSYTGLSESELDDHEDITDALLILCTDRYDNRNFYVDPKASKVNESVKSILGLHSTNLL